MTMGPASDEASVDRVDAALFHDHSAPDDQKLVVVTDIAQSDEGARLLDRLDDGFDALYLGAENTFEGVALRGEPARQPARRLVWQFWNGEGWGPLDVDRRPDEVAADGRRIVFRWTASSDWQLLDQGIDSVPVAPQYWIRARLA